MWLWDQIMDCSLTKHSTQNPPLPRLWWRHRQQDVRCGQWQNLTDQIVGNELQWGHAEVTLYWTMVETKLIWVRWKQQEHIEKCLVSFNIFKTETPMMPCGDILMDNLFSYVCTLFQFSHPLVMFLIYDFGHIKVGNFFSCPAGFPIPDFSSSLSVKSVIVAYSIR